MKRRIPLLVILISAAVLAGAFSPARTGEEQDTVTCWRCHKAFEPDRVARRGVCPYCGAKYILPPATPPPPPPRAEGQEAEPGAEEGPAADTVPYREAGSHMGQTITIEGRIVSTHLSSRSGNLYLNYDRDFKSFVSIKIPSASLSRFPSRDESYYMGKTVRATGRIVREGQYLRQEVTRPEDLVIY